LGKIAMNGARIDDAYDSSGRGPAMVELGRRGLQGRCDVRIFRASAIHAVELD
jgi:hypothetical protein